MQVFGYVGINPRALSEVEQQRFRAAYCGLCHVLKAEYGNIGRLTLSNDMTFLSLLLGALYEPQEQTFSERCAPHPFRQHPAMAQSATSFAAAMNVLLAYYKCADDRADEGSLRGKAGMRLLQGAYERVQAAWPTQCAQVRDALEALSQLEAQRTEELDAPVRLSGQMLGACFVWRQDAFAPALRQIGAALGRFVYLMDAYEDFAADEKRGRYNPLRALRGQPDYEERVAEMLRLEMAQCVQAFDYLPIEQDAGLLRNILYSGVWGRYAALQEKQGKEERP